MAAVAASGSGADYLPMDVDDEGSGSGSVSGPMQLYLCSSNKEDINIALTTIVSLNNDRFEETIRSHIPRNFVDWALMNAMDNSNKIVLRETNDDSKGAHIIVDVSSPSSWTLCATLPDLPPSGPFRRRFLLKVAMLDDAVLGLSGFHPRRLLVFTTPQSKGWTFMDGEYDAFDHCDGFKDLTSCKKDRLFYALSIFSSKVVSISFTSSSSSSDVKTEDVTYNLAPVFDPCNRTRRYRGWACQEEGKLVDTPSDGLFLVRWRRLFKEGKGIRREVDVSKLLNDGVKKEWVVVNSLPNCSFFVSNRQSVVLTPRDFPNLRCNRIYIAHDAYHNVQQMSDNLEKLASDNIEYYHIYNLEDGSWGKLPKPEDILLKNIADQAVWLMPPPKV